MMADWTRGMARTYEYWRVDPATWGDAERLATVTGCTIVRDMEQPTLGSAAFSMDAFEGEMYVRAYLVTSQDGLRERWPLGTFLVQAPTRDFDGMRASTVAEGYTPLRELAEKYPPIGYSSPTGDAAELCASLIGANARCPAAADWSGWQVYEPFVAEDGETWLGFISALASSAGCALDLDGRGCVTVGPAPDAMGVSPVRTFDDGNSSILLPDASDADNMPDVPNVVEVVHSAAGAKLSAKVVDADPASPASTVVRGREVHFRECSPDLPETATQADVDSYARELMREKGAVVHTIAFSHAFVPDVRPGAGVMLDYLRAGIRAKAMVVSQTIECTPACTVQTVARYTEGR